MTQLVHVVCPTCSAINRIPAGKMSANPSCGKCGKPVFPGHPIDLNANNFMQHINRNDIPVVVDFWAPWCGPCKTMAPWYSDAAEKLEPRVRFAKLNTENEQAIGAKFNVRSIPTLILFRKGKEIARSAGAMQSAQIVNWIQAQL
ncbi:MAG: thioredoxin TrxC [Xanthomonadales bacterium]|nr:thioredoxin TrxC [Xanthomonadales bacterium]